MIILVRFGSIQWSPGAGEGGCLHHATPPGETFPSLVCLLVRYRRCYFPFSLSSLVGSSGPPAFSVIRVSPAGA